MNDDMDRRGFFKTVKSAVVQAASGEASGAGRMLQNFPGVGALGFGCMRWPMTKDKDGKDVVDQQKVDAMVDKALEAGINYFDTAPVYLQGQSEGAAAKALNRYPRDRWLLATKLSNFRMGDNPYEDGVRMFRHSLDVFGTDHVDYYLLHSVSGLANFRKRFEETGLMDFVLEQRRMGRIRNLGFSFHGKREGFDELVALHGKYHWDFVQIQMNYLDWRHPDRGDASAEYMYGVLERLGIPVVIMEPIRGGSLANLPSAESFRLRTLEPDRSAASWALRFAAGWPGVLTVLSGMECMEHLEDNLGTFRHFQKLSDKELDLLEEVAVNLHEYPLVGCTGCKYCMPCPYGIDIPGIFAFYNKTVNDGTYVSSGEQKGYAGARRRYLLSYNKAVPTVRQADHCISCGKCMPQCPQHIRIPQELSRIDAYIEKLKRQLF